MALTDGNPSAGRLETHRESGTERPGAPTSSTVVSAERIEPSTSGLTVPGRASHLARLAFIALSGTGRSERIESAPLRDQMRTTQRGADGASERAEDGIAESSPVRAGDAIEGPEQPTDERAMAGPPECSPPLPPAIPIPVVFVAPSSAWALGLLNPNAFPIPLKRHAQDLAHRLAAFRVACENVVRDVPQPSALVAKLRKISGPDFAPTDDKPIVAIYDAMTFVGSLYGMLVTMKTLLDVYAPMITDAVTPKERLKGFNSGKFEGAIGPGGKVLNWLLKQSQLRTVGGECASKLLEILRPEVAGWIATAIGWRDAAVH